MVQQAYIHRLILGRSAFEPPDNPEGNEQSNDANTLNPAADDASPIQFAQTYDNRGNPQNPASRAQARRIVRAYNEVLSTVGVCARVESEGRHGSFDQAKGSSERVDEAIVDENEAGFWLSFVTEILYAVTNTVSVNLRQRIQTFDIYSGIPLLYVFTEEVSLHGIMRVFLAGEFANWTFTIAWAASTVLIDFGCHALMRRFGATRDGGRKSQVKYWAISIGERLAELSVFLILYPYQVYADLQRLYLLPFWPLLPNPLSVSSFRSSPPRLPTIRNMNSLMSWSMAVATCPATLYLGMQLASVTLSSSLTRYALCTMPRPDNPDDASFRITDNGLLERDGPEANRLRYQDSLQTEVARDINSIKQVFTDLGLQLRNVWRRYVVGKRATVVFPNDINSAVSPVTELDSSPFPEVQGSSSSGRVPAPLDIAGTTSTTSDSTLLTPVSSDAQSDSGEVNASNVRIRARASSTSTLHMDVEFTATNEADGPVHTSSFAASPNPRSSMEMTYLDSSPHPYHRVTALSFHAAESLSSHTMATLMTVLYLPIETLYLRSITRNFLNTRQTSGWLIERVYSSNTWFGVGLHASWLSLVDYPSKILLCLAVELLTKMQVWRLSCKAAFWLGTRVFGWGKL